MSYVLNTPDDQQAMLAQIGVSSIDDLFGCIPPELRLARPLAVPEALSEQELTQLAQGLAGRNRSPVNAVCFLGGGSYDHFIPAVVDAIAGRSEYYTAYTPYQAEASQGSLQAFFEFQTMICQLTGLDVSNASLYEAGSAVAEAVLMAVSATNRLGKVIVAESVHPHHRQTLGTYLANLEPQVVTLPTPNGFLDPDDLPRHLDEKTACVVVQHPNFFGCLEEVEACAAAAHRVGAQFIVVFDPISLGVLKRPGQYGADIAVAEGQSLGSTMAYGGPYLGLLTCRSEHVRKIPGRLVGQTVDRQGKRCFVLTLQTREQHIRREKATSNICTNQGLYALRAAVYLAALGPEGLKETAELCLRKAHYAARQLATIEGVGLRFDRPFFKEFTLQLPRDREFGEENGGTASWLSSVQQHGYLGGLELGHWYPWLLDCVSVAVTEKRTREEIDGLVRAYRASSPAALRAFAGELSSALARSLGSGD